MYMMREPGLTAKDVMRTDVITVPQEMNIWELAELFASKGISGAPVADTSGNLVGVVSQTDIVRHLEVVTKSSRGANDFYAESEYSVSRPILKMVTTGDVMSRGAICALETTPIEELSKIMLSRGIHRIIITRGKKIVGIVTAMDLLKVL